MAERFLHAAVRLSDETVQAFGKPAAAGKLGTATVYEAAGKPARGRLAGKAGAMDHTIRPLRPGLRLCGRALTVRGQPGDNLTLHVAIAMAQPDDVIVADVGGFLDAGHWGEIMTVAAQARRLAGLVINGSVRDLAAHGRRGFPIFGAGVCMRAAVKETPGYINHPIVCGGVPVRPGDLVLGDDDGVVVVEHGRAAEILAACHKRESDEALVMTRLEKGELTLDVLGFRQALDRHGLKV